MGFVEFILSVFTKLFHTIFKVSIVEKKSGINLVYSIKDLHVYV